LGSAAQSPQESRISSQAAAAEVDAIGAGKLAVFGRVHPSRSLAMTMSENR